MTAQHSKKNGQFFRDKAWVGPRAGNSRLFAFSVPSRKTCEWKVGCTTWEPPMEAQISGLFALPKAAVLVVKNSVMLSGLGERGRLSPQDGQKVRRQKLF